MGQIRLDKYLGEMGQGTRTQLKEAARKGRIQVNGITEKKSERKIDPEQDTISMDSRIIGYARYEYYMLNKPKGVVSATADNLHITVIALLDRRLRDDLFPVGRLDIDTEGLLLITNDGDLAHRLLSPKKHVDKVYYAEIAGHLPKDVINRFEKGIVLTDGTLTRPAKLELQENDGETAKVLLTIREGKFHQVKRMFEAIECDVLYLKRMSMGCLVLDEALEPGDYRPLTEAELTQLKDENG